ncbi:MAG: tRNA (guanosine(46)-N7)-methyltransferase TrmB [Anaerolineae bacterium]|nr:tRNA (guanosine(46)-N7)-methyltransferase TrmB [Anaerolineae bacterium]
MKGVHKPIELDLGFGRGEFLMQRALENPERQFVGIEIRDYLLEKMRQCLREDPRDNIYLVHANIKQHLPVLFDPGMLSCVYIHFPDPWTTRKKHRKRRMVDADLVATLYTLLEPEGQVHLMTDKKEVGLEMLSLFSAHGGFTNVCGPDAFCPESTTGIRTREEEYYITRGDPIYRLKFARDHCTNNN